MCINALILGIVLGQFLFMISSQPWISNANVSDGRGRGEILSQDDGKDISRVGIQS